jgi:C-terminal processing protease CtpA/Prc
VAAAASYFFGGRTHLSDIFYRGEEKPTEVWTTPVPAELQLVHQDVYILTSSRTFSAAEDFCYALKTQRHAVVVGETTGGGAHTGRGLVRLSPLFTAFIPVGRLVSPVTHMNWEGVGITPDVATTSTDALRVAHIQAVRRRIEVETDAAWREQLTRTLIDLQSK